MAINQQPDFSRLQVELTSVTFTNTNAVSLTPNNIDQAEFENSSASPQMFTYQHQYTDTKTHTWTISDTFHAGVKFSGQANLLITSAQLEVDFSFTDQRTNTWTDTQMEMLTVSEPVAAPAESIITATWVLQRLDNVILPFNATFELTGIMSFSILAVTGEYTWTGSAGQFIAAAVKGGAQNWTVNGDVANYAITGTLVADQGVHTLIKIEQRSLSGGSVKVSVVNPSNVKSSAQ